MCTYFLFSTRSWCVYIVDVYIFHTLSWRGVSRRAVCTRCTHRTLYTSRISVRVKSVFLWKSSLSFFDQRVSWEYWCHVLRAVFVLVARVKCFFPEELRFAFHESKSSWEFRLVFVLVVRVEFFIPWEWRVPFHESRSSWEFRLYILRQSVYFFASRVFLSMRVEFHYYHYYFLFYESTSSWEFRLCFLRVEFVFLWEKSFFSRQTIESLLPKPLSVSREHKHM